MDGNTRQTSHPTGGTASEWDDYRDDAGVKQPGRIFRVVCPAVQVRMNIETFVKDHETGRVAVQWCLPSKGDGEERKREQDVTGWYSSMVSVICESSPAVAGCCSKQDNLLFPKTCVLLFE